MIPVFFFSYILTSRTFNDKLEEKTKYRVDGIQSQYRWLLSHMK